jgi:hypothetical protein
MKLKQLGVPEVADPFRIPTHESLNQHRNTVPHDKREIAKVGRTIDLAQTALLIWCSKPQTSKKKKSK